MLSQPCRRLGSSTLQIRAQLLDSLKLASFIHPARTFLPCSGVGRHMIGVLQLLDRRTDVDLCLLFAEQWLENGRLPGHCPLRDLSFRTIPGNENQRERFWKMFRLPRLDPGLTRGSDWVYCPMETRLPEMNTPVAITVHDVQPFEVDLPWSRSRENLRNRRMWSVWLPKSLRESRAIFTVSEFSKRRMVELLGADERKVVVSGNGVDDIYFQAGETELSQLHEAPYILTVGGLRPQKGGGEFLGVAKVLRKRMPEMRFVVAGGPHDLEMVARAKEIGGFEFPGIVPDSAMPGLLKDAVCLLFLSPYEGFGMPPLEAMACGTPAIVSNRASLPEVVGDAALVFSPDETGEIVEAVLSLAEDPALRKSWGQKGRARALGFRWAEVANRVYTGLLSRS